MFGVGYGLSIPLFSIALILIDALFDLIFKHNFIKQLLITTSITIHKSNRQFRLVQQLPKFKPLDVYREEGKNLTIPKVFLTVAEQNWLKTEIQQYLQEDY